MNELAAGRRSSGAGRKIQGLGADSGACEQQPACQRDCESDVQAVLSSAFRFALSYSLMITSFPAGLRAKRLTKSLLLPNEWVIFEEFNKSG
jgi:hypothetical protein